MEKREAERAALEIYEKIGRCGSRSPEGMDFPTGRELALSLGYPPEVVREAPDAILDAFVGAYPLPSLVDGLLDDKTMADLGCGSGLDSFWLALKGARVHALDQSPSMAGRLALAAREKRLGVFPSLALLPYIPFKSGAFDLALSNGVANIVTDKEELAGEVFRILREGGVWLMADVVALGEIDEELRQSPEAWAFCVGGALSPREWVALAEGAGFTKTEFSLIETFQPLGRGVLRARK